MTGPPRKPNAIRRGGTGTAAAAKKPRPEQVAPTCPRKLCREEKVVWHRLVETLTSMGLVAISDGGAYARYAALLVEWWALHLDLRKNGRTYEVHGKDGQVVGINPRAEVKMRNTISVELRRMESEFGLTPAARERLTADLPPIQEQEGKGRFFAVKVVG